MNRTEQRRVVVLNHLASEALVNAEAAELLGISKRQLQRLRSVLIDLTNIGGSENVSAAFGGATSLTVMQMLQSAASQSNAGGSPWYGSVKATQGLAKYAFDGVNNQIVFGP
jgi:hypothetical protein